MEVLILILILILIVSLIVIFLIPVEEEEENIKNYRRLTHCDIHEWESLPNQVDEGKYTRCSVCKFLPESGNYQDFGT